MEENVYGPILVHKKKNDPFTLPCHSYLPIAFLGSLPLTQILFWSWHTSSSWQDDVLQLRTMLIAQRSRSKLGSKV